MRAWKFSTETCCQFLYNRYRMNSFASNNLSLCTALHTWGCLPWKGRGVDKGWIGKELVGRKGKGKDHPITGHERTEGGSRGIALLFIYPRRQLGGGWSTPRPGRFTPREWQVFLWGCPYIAGGVYSCKTGCLQMQAVNSGLANTLNKWQAFWMEQFVEMPHIYA
jgi:hypothetical protein